MQADLLRQHGSANRTAAGYRYALAHLWRLSSAHCDNNLVSSHRRHENWAFTRRFRIGIWKWNRVAPVLVVLPVVRIFARALRDRRAQLLPRVPCVSERLREARIDYVNIARLPSARRNADASDAAREQRNAFVETNRIDRDRDLRMLACFHHGDSAVRSVETKINVHRIPRRQLLLLADAVAPCRRMTHRPFRKLARVCASDIPQYHPDPSADRGVVAAAFGPDDPH